MDLDLANLEAFDLSIPLRFNGPQPNAWGVPIAAAEAVAAGEMIGDTRRGGSVNFERYSFIPHCSGTHTECVGHITHERISIRVCLQDVLMPALLVSVSPEVSITGDSVISGNSLAEVIADRNVRVPALIVRTLPNGDWKATAEYGERNVPPYFAQEAMDLIVELGFKHLLVDLPSIDRIFDGGRLVNHRKFWNVDAGSHDVHPQTRINSTITELIYVPDEAEDGGYLLNLQLAPFESDCAPSRPILLRKH